MTDDKTTLAVGPSVEQSTLRRIVSIGLALGGLLVLLGLVSLLPGIDRLVAGLSISPFALLSAIATALVVVALLWVAPTVGRAVEEALDGPAAVVRNASSAAALLVGFLAVVVAYRGFAPAVTPLFDAFGLEGIYHLAFLVLGVFVLVAFARHLYKCWEPMTGVLTEYATDALGKENGNGVSTE